jgi:hypothetical protein
MRAGEENEGRRRYLKEDGDIEINKCSLCHLTARTDYSASLFFRLNSVYLFSCSVRNHH